MVSIALSGSQKTEELLLGTVLTGNDLDFFKKKKRLLLFVSTVFMETGLCVDFFLFFFLW